MTTLKERLEELTANLPRGWKADLARHCKISPVSVNDWTSGKSKSIDGSYLTFAADFFNVNPHWLATGEGEKTKRITQEVLHTLPPPTPQDKFSPMAQMIAKMYDKIPESDVMGRIQAFNVSTTEIQRILAANGLIGSDSQKG